MSRLLQLPAELLDSVLGACFLEGWANSKVTCDPALGLRLMSRACNLSIRRLISTDPSLRSDGNCQKAFWKAVQKGCPTVIIQHMLDRADVNEYDQSLLFGGPLFLGCAALHYAAYTGRVALVLLILEKGADIEAKNVEHCTPLHTAALGASGTEAVVDMLLEKGADVDAKDGYGNQALHMAAMHGNVAVVETLLEKGADINAQADNNFTALHYAASRGLKTVVGLLLEKGADTHPLNYRHDTPLRIAEDNEDAAEDDEYSGVDKEGATEAKILLARAAWREWLAQRRPNLAILI